MAAPKKNTPGRAKKTPTASPKKTQSKVTEISDEEMASILKAQQDAEEALKQAEQGVREAMQKAQEAMQNAIQGYKDV